MTLKVICVKVAHMWGGKYEYTFEVLKDQPAEVALSITLYEEGNRTFKLGESYELTLQ